MNIVGQREIRTQLSVIAFFQNTLAYSSAGYLAKHAGFRFLKAL